MNRWGLLVHDLIIGNITKGDFNKKMAGLISIGIIIMAGAAEDEAREWLYNFLHKKDLKADNRSIPEKVLVNLSSTAPFFGNFIEAASMGRDANPPIIRTFASGFSGVKQVFTGKDTASKTKGVLKATEAPLTIFLGYPGTAQFYDLLESALSEPKGGRR
jgi:hypothetical protein